MDETHTNTSTDNTPSPAQITRDSLAQQIERDTAQRLSRIDNDFSNGFEIIAKHTNTVTIFGSARFTEEHPYYQLAQSLSETLSEDGYTIITGGGGGIMEAGNRGAFEAGGDSVGFNIELPHEQTLNPYTTASMPFRYFFSRKVLLAFAAEAYIYFPGGFGTLDEFFEILTLMQTKKVAPAPIICVGDEFWNPLADFIRERLLEDFQTISPEDQKLYTITEDIDTIRSILNAHKQNRITKVLTGSTL